MQDKQASINGPDFICIGMPKAGTGWLYDQLSHHPDFWMPPVKELHYLDRTKPLLKNSVRLLNNWVRACRRAERNGLRWGEQESAFLEQVVSSVGEPRDVRRYAIRTSLDSHEHQSAPAAANVRVQIAQGVRETVRND